MQPESRGRRPFHVEILKPSHYDDDGYLIQWHRAFVPSNSLACLYALVEDAHARKALGPGVAIVPRAYDECHTAIPVEQIIGRCREEGGGVVFLAGVQTNQFPRAVDLARQFRAAGVPVVLGGFHASGSLAMLGPDCSDLRALADMGVSVFAGEAEGRLDLVLSDAYGRRLRPLYNYLGQLPDLQGQPTPWLPPEVQRRYMFFAPFDCGRGCPFHCSFCTIINVQGHKSRYRGADDVERLVRAGLAQGVRRFFVTDDNLARNQNWEPIFDRLIAIREKEGIRLKFSMQVDTLSHKVPGFVEKAARAGCNRVFIGLENVNPDNLRAINKRQNRVSDYREMLQAWRSRGAVTYAGYILGLPNDTPQSIERDIRLIQEELPVDILEFMLLTPLPGSADHQSLSARGVWMDPDLNKYDLEHVTTLHPRMTASQWAEIYDRAWHLYYSPEHVATLLRRARAGGAGTRHVAHAILSYYASYRFEKVHPLQCGLLRRKRRTARRPGMPRENAIRFFFRRAWETASTYLGLGRYYLQLERLRKQVEAAPGADDYCDPAIADPEPQILKFPTPLEQRLPEAA